MGRRATKPNAENCSEAELKIAARAAPTQGGYARMMAIRALILGTPQSQAAELFGVSGRTLSNWVRRFNEQGIDGLLDRPGSGRPRKIPQDRSSELRGLVAHPESVGETHWTARKFHGYLSQALQVEVGYSTVVRWLHEQDFRLKVPRSWPQGQDESLRQAFVEQVQQWLQDEQVELWYLDETGIEADPRPRRRWVHKGERARVPHRGKHIRVSVIGMVCPRTGEFFSLEVPYTDTAVLKLFLEQAQSQTNRTRPRNLLICDNASWHKSRCLTWGSFQPVFLPPYSPDLNPIERLWLLLKAEWFSDFIAKDREALTQRLDQALNWVIDRQSQNTVTCRI